MPFYFARSLRLKLLGRLASAAWPPSDRRAGEQPPEVKAKRDEEGQVATDEHSLVSGGLLSMISPVSDTVK